MVSKEVTKQTAHLARLHFDQQELEAMQDRLGKIIDWMDKLAEVDTEGVAPLIHLSTELNVLREDVATASFTHEQALANAPKRDSDYFRVPKVIE